MRRPKPDSIVFWQIACSRCMIRIDSFEHVYEMKFYRRNTGEAWIFLQVCETCMVKFPTFVRERMVQIYYRTVQDATDLEIIFHSLWSSL